MHIAVLIPFRGDRQLLQWTIDGYRSQQLSPGDSLEVLVGEDGGDPSQPTVAAPHEQGDTQVRLHQFPRIGAAAVRNSLAQLIAPATDLLIFGNADARPHVDMVSTHARTMMQLPAGSLILGSAPWETPASPTVFDALLAETPLVFFYNGLKAHTWYDFRHAWTLNLSIRVADFRASGGFHDQLRPVYYEDLAFAHRLMGGDRKAVWYEPAARVIHRHPTTLDQYLDREELLGLMAPVLADQCPAAFETLLHTRDVARLAPEFQTWVAMDAASHQWIYKRLADWAALPESDLGTGPRRQRTLNTIYQMHIPLKRLAFRLGFLKGMQLRDDKHWQERRPQGLWRNIALP